MTCACVFVDRLSADDSRKKARVTILMIGLIASLIWSLAAYDLMPRAKRGATPSRFMRTPRTRRAGYPWSRDAVIQLFAPNVGGLIHEMLLVANGRVCTHRTRLLTTRDYCDGLQGSRVKGVCVGVHYLQPDRSADSDLCHRTGLRIHTIGYIIFYSHSAALWILNF